MWARCERSKEVKFLKYREKGIKVCDEWRDFKAFIKDMGVKPSSGHTIDRIDNDKGYYPANCKWSTRKQQQRNRDNTVFLTYNGEKKPVSEWAEIVGIKAQIIYARVKNLNWDTEKALTTKSRNNKISIK